MPANTHTVVGHTKRFECRVIGHPRPEIRWFKDGRDITHNQRYNFDHTYEGVISMVIEDVHHKDEGHYRCRAENSEGFASTSAYLIVKPHKEHPDEEVEEVHAMQLDEHFVFKGKKDRTIFVDNDDMEMEVDATRKRTFEEIVGEEKESKKEIVNGTVSKSISSSIEESSYSKKSVNGYEEVSSPKSSSKKVKSTLGDDSVIKLVSQQELSVTSESYSMSKSVAEESAKSSVSSKSEIESVSSSAKKTEEMHLSVSSSVEESKVKRSSNSEESIVGFSVETEQSSSSFKSKTESKSSLETSVEIEEQSSKLKKCVGTSEAELSSVASKESKLSVESEYETSSKSKAKVSEVTVEEVPEECRLQPLGGDDPGDQPARDMTDSGPTSLGNDSGFMEASMVESSQFESFSVDSTLFEELAVDSAKVSLEEGFSAKATKEEADKSHVKELVITETTETTSRVENMLEGSSKPSITEETLVKAETMEVSKEISLAEEVSEDTPLGGDITGLLDEKPDPTTAVAEEQEVEAAAEDRDQRGRWVDQITTKTESLTIEGEGKKVEEQKESETAKADKKQEAGAELEIAAAENAVEAAVNVERLLARQGSVVNELQVAGEDIADSSVEASKKQRKSHESRLEVDEGISAQNVLGLERARPRVGEEVAESSVDAVKPEGRAEAAVAGLSAPRIVAAPDDIAVVLGEAIRLASQVQGNPTPEVKWFKAGDTVKAGERITLATADDVFTLEITDALESDGGTYTLTAHNSQGTIFSDVLVTVSIPPSIGPADEEIRVTASLSIPEFVAQPGNVTVKELGKLQLVCTIKANPSPTIEWSKEGKTLASDSHISIFESEGRYFLEIPRANAEDSGDYTCTATNSQGSVSCSISVFVESKESSVSGAEEGAGALKPLSQRESSSDVSTLEPATIRYLKLVAAAAAFSLAAFGIKKVVENLPK